MFQGRRSRERVERQLVEARAFLICQLLHRAPRATHRELDRLVARPARDRSRVMLGELRQVVDQVVRMKQLERLRDLLMKLHLPQPRKICRQRFWNHRMAESEAARRIAVFLDDPVRHAFREPRDAFGGRERGHLRQQLDVKLAPDH